MLSPDGGLVVPHADREAAHARAQAKRAAAFAAMRDEQPEPLPGQTTLFNLGGDARP